MDGSSRPRPRARWRICPRRRGDIWIGSNRWSRRRSRTCRWARAEIRSSGCDDMAVAAPKDLDLLIVGAGPCGLAAAISAQRAGLRARVLDANCVVSTITQYPYYVSFFSTAEKLSLGGIPFVVSTEKPTRRDGLAYYRAIVRHFKLDVHQYERVTRLER